VASGAWNGQKAYNIQSPANQVLRNNYLKDGTNILQIAVAGDDPTNKYDKVALDYLKVKYYRLYEASRDEIDFTRPEGSPNELYTFKVSEFSSPDISIYKVGKSKLRDFSSEYVRSSKSYRITLQDYVADDTTLYWAACGEALKIPLNVKLDTLSDLSSGGRGANIVIITRQEWINSLTELTDFYAENSLAAQVVGIEDISNEFMTNVTPFAVKNSAIRYHN
jgi:hypothetical protein